MDIFASKNEPATAIFHFGYMMIPIQITEKAQSEIRNIMANKNIPTEYALRVGVKGGGCGGMSYLLGFDKAKTGDEQFEIGGIPVLIEKKHLMFLMGIQVDFVDEAEARGFTFVNPEIPKRHDVEKE